MKRLDNHLFDKIAAFQIGSQTDTLTFADRLCRENNWSHAFAERCIAEYKKFIYLAVTSSEPVTPSDEVDQVWHLHLTYTHSYWIGLCQNTLNKTLHHGPTQGGSAEGLRYRSQYQATLERYNEVFGQRPAADIWPAREHRFKHADKFVRVNTARQFVVKKPSSALLAITTLPLLLAACVKNEAEADVLIALIVLLVAYACYRLFQAARNHKQTGGSSGGCGSAGSGGSSGNSRGQHNDVDSGCGGCGGCGA